MTLLKQNSGVSVPLVTNALVDWVVQGATTLHKLFALFVFCCPGQRPTANFEPC